MNSIKKKIALTGIKPTGMPHLGNYFGAIKPALELTREYETFFFIADYHALNTIKDRDELHELTYDIAASWLACGLNPKQEECYLYKQSDIPEICELETILLAFTAKGLLNRAHAYKAKVTDNLQHEKDADSEVNMGLYTYPVLMAADILLFDADIVPVGKDQLQHVEITADIAEAVNRNYKKELFKIPEANVQEEVQVVVGLDGRKMSKSYQNTIELFLDEHELHDKIMKIVTTSQSVDEKKNPEDSYIFSLYKLFTAKEQQMELARKFKTGGMSWSYAKEELFKAMNSYLKPMRKKYEYFKNNQFVIDEIWRQSTAKLHEIATNKIRLIRKELGVTKTFY